MASRPIDEKIVKLSVDDADFKSKLIDSLKNLASFGNALKNVDGGNLDNISSAASASAKSIAEIGNSAEISKSKFSLLATAAAVALGNIASNAVASGLHLVKALTLDPIKQGFQQYQDKMQSMMALLVALGEGAKGAINGAVNELTTYANKTVYSVNDMIGALSTLVNQGIGLNDAVTVIKGFGNAAAVAGVDTNTFKSQLDTALTQAYALGHMDYPNFKQLEMSHIVTKQFKDAMLDAAKAQGISVDLSKGFNASLADGWANVNVMNAAMKTLAENPAMLNAAQQFHSLSQATDATRESIVTGWAGVWEILIGDVNASTKLWTSLGGAVSDVITNIFKGIESLAQKFVNLGGMTKIVNLLIFTVSSLYKPIAAIGKAFIEAFPGSGLTGAKIAVTLINLLSDALHVILAPLQLIGPAFQIFFGALNVVYNVIKLLLTPLTTLFKMFTKGTDLEKIVNSFTDWSKVLGDVSKHLSAFFGNIRSFFANADKVVSNGTIKFVTSIINTVKYIIDLTKKFINLTEVLSGLTLPFVLVARAANVGTKSITPLMAVIGLFRAVIETFKASLKYLGDTIHNIGAGFKAFFGQMTFVFAPLSKLKDNFKAINPEFEKMSDGLGIVGRSMQPFVQFVIGLIKNLNKLNEYLSTSGGAFKNFNVEMTNAGQTVRNFITNLVDSFNNSAVVTAARQLGKDIIDGLTIGVSNKALDLFAFIKPALDGFIKSIRELFDIHSPSRVMQEIGRNIIDGLTLGMSQALGALPNFFGKVGTTLKFIAQVIVKAVTGAIKLVVQAFGNIINLIAPYSQALGQIFGAVGQAISVFLNNLNTPAALKGGIIVSLVGWLHALNKADGPGIIHKILHPLQTLKDIFKEKFGDGGGMLDQVKNTLRSYQREIKTRMLIDIAAAIGILAGAMWILSTIPAGKLVTASVGMATAAGSLAIMFKTLSNVADSSKTIDVVKITAVVIGISIALGIMASSITKLSTMNPEGAIVAVVAMGVLLLELSIAMKKGFNIDPKKDLVKITSLIAVTLVISKLAKDLENLSKLSWNDMIKGLVGMGAIVTMLSIVLKFMKVPDKKSVVGFTGLALALNLAMIPIIALGLIPWPIVLMGVAMMSTILGALSGINVILNKFGGSKGGAALLEMALALNLAVVPIVALGLIPWPIVLRGIGFMALALGALTGINVLMSKFGTGGGSAALMVMVLALGKLVPSIIVLGALPWQLVGAGIVAMAVALGVLIAASFASQAVLPGMMALSLLLDSFAAAALSFGFGISLIVAAISVLVGIVVAQGAKIVKGLSDILIGIGNLGPSFGRAVATLFGGLVSGFAMGIANNFGSLVQSAVQIIDALVQGILSAAPILINGVMVLLDQLVDAILSEIDIIALKIGNGLIDLINTLALFIQNNTDAILNAVGNVIRAIITLITTALGDMLGGIPGIGGKLKSAVIDAGKKASDGLASTFPPGMQAATAKGAEEAINGISSKKEEMREQALQLAMNAKDGASQITSFLSLLGIQGGDEFVSGVKSGAIPAQDAGNLLKEMAKAGASNGSLEEMAKAMGGTYADGVFTLDTAQKTSDAAKKLPQTATDAAKPTEDQKTDLKTAMAGLAGQAGLGVESKLTDADSASKHVNEVINNNLNKTTDHSGAGAQTAGSKTEGVESKVPDAANAANDVNNVLNNNLNKTTDHSGAGARTAGSKADGASSQQGKASNAANDVNSVLNNRLSRTTDHSGAGARTAGSKADGVSSQKGRMSGAVGEIDLATDKLGNTKDFSGTGTSMVDSLVGGIQSAWESSKHIISGIGQFISDHLRGNSPTKKGPLHDDWYGIVGVGAKIVTEIAGNMQKAMPRLSDMTYNVASLLSSSINDINTRVDSVSDWSPTITPVVDMKNIDNLDLSSFDSLGTISGGSFLSKVQYENMNQNQQQIVQTNSLVNELQSGFTTLRDSLDTLNNLNDGQLQYMQNQPRPDVYMDGTRVTDTLAPKMIKAQNDYNNTMAYIGGIQQSL